MSPAKESGLAIPDRIRKAVASGNLTLPPLPELASELRELLSDDDYEIKQVDALIRNEPAIVASLLKVANSAAFGGLRQITDLTQVIARLGTRRVTSLVNALLLKGQFDHGDPDKTVLLGRLWDHAVATGIASRRLALRDGGDPEESFLAGLLHDTGKLLVLKGVEAIENEGEERLTRALIDELIDLLHTELGYSALKSWNIADSICEVARDHHTDVESGETPLRLHVQAANLLAKKLGAHPKPQTGITLTDQPEIEMIGIGDVELAELMVDLEDEVDEVRSMF